MTRVCVCVCVVRKHWLTTVFHIRTRSLARVFCVSSTSPILVISWCERIANESLKSLLALPNQTRTKQFGRSKNSTKSVKNAKKCLAHKLQRWWWPVWDCHPKCIRRWWNRSSQWCHKNCNRFGIIQQVCWSHVTTMLGVHRALIHSLFSSVAVAIAGSSGLLKATPYTPKSVICDIVDHGQCPSCIY